jgi:class 3 adenylate cyclase/tetratricopeptide (TPR) repeat protein
MAVWSSEIKEIERLFKPFKGQIHDLDKELEQLIRSDDPNVIMLYSRRCLEVIITDLCELELKRPRKTEPLKGIIDKLQKEELIPSHILTSMHGLNALSTYGAHPKDYDPEQVKPVLNNLYIIIKWYMKYKGLWTPEITKQEEERDLKKKQTLSRSATVVAGRKRETERRLTTLIYAELDEYDLMLRELDEEERASLMKSVFELFDLVTRIHNGILKKMSANIFMIFFGLPSTSEDSPKTAINFSIDLRNRLTGFVKEKKITTPLNIKIGINTGEVIVDHLIIDGKTEYSVFGDSVDFAEVLKNYSKNGDIIAGPLTYKFAKKEFEFQSLKPVNQEGKNEEVTIYKLLSVREKIYRSELSGERMVFSELVGREKEMERLHRHLLDLINGKGSIVSIMGEAGIGKSRLIAELRNKDEMSSVIYLEGRALSIGKNLSFHPIIDILRKFAEISEDDNGNDAFNKFEALVHRIHPGSAVEIFPFIATLVGLGLTGRYAERLNIVEGEALESLIFKNIRDFFSKAAESKPLVIIIEDLHWADQSSIGLLESLYQLAETHKLFFINAFRPGYEETSDRILSTIRDRYPDCHEEIIIEPLDFQQTEILFGNLLKINILPAKLDALVRERAEGNPFFIEEVVRSLIDSGAVIFQNGTFKVSNKIENVVIPETISELLMSRIDKLEESTRSLLKMASVIGRNFFYKILFEIISEKEEIEDMIEDLKEAQLIMERKRMAEVEYLFKHALVQQTVYSTLLVKQRKELHIKVAQAIEKVFPDRLQDFFGTLAFHYTNAEELDEAEKYLILAGERALKSSASSEALNYYRDALAIYRKKYGKSTDPEKIAMFEKNIGIALLNKGHFIDSGEYFEKVLAYYEMKVSKNPIISTGKFIYGFLNILLKLTFPSRMARKMPSGREMEIIELIEKRTISLTITDAKTLLIELISYFPWYSKFDISKNELLLLNGLFFSFGGLSQRIGKNILNFYGERYKENSSSPSFTYKCFEFNSGLWTGDWDAMKYDTEVTKQGLLKGDLYNIVTYVAFQAHLCLEQGDREADKFLEQVLEISEMYGYDYGRLAYGTHRTLYLLKFRKIDEALDMSNEAIFFVQKTLGNKPALLMSYSLKFRIQILMADIKGAVETMNIADELSSADTYPPYFLTFYTTSRFIMHLHQMKEALKAGNRDLFKKIRNITFRSGRKAIRICRYAAFERTETYRLMGIYFWLVGNVKMALKWWGRSINEAAKLGAKLELSRTYYEVGKRLSEKKTKRHLLAGIGAEEYLKKAGDLFSEMHLTWDQNELKSAY